MAETALSENNLYQLLEKIYTDKGWDFRQYRKSSLNRCISRRLSFARMSYSDYVSLLDSEPSEFNNLFNNITIKVSAFFRDPEVFRRIEEDVLPVVLQELKVTGRDRLRIWSCGCAMGEEAYSTAILLSRSFRNIPEDYKIKIFATDIDEAAIEIARKGVYREESLKNVDSTIRNAYFHRSGNGCQVPPHLKNLITFGVHDIVSDIHLSHMDIILCRNLLIYFERDLQEKTFEKFYYSLNRGGFIILGKSEVVPPLYRDRFLEICKKDKIYQKL